MGAVQRSEEHTSERSSDLYTDTVDYLKEYLAEELPGLTIATYTGDGGAQRDASGTWVRCSKETVKRRLREGRIRLLVANDAAGFLKSRLDQRFVAEIPDRISAVLWEIPVKHLLRFGGDEGVL